ncbi:hypothetical protein TDB9533_00859 [Thalassocella blandensis]|nr:hypothetical protein TDB9533_00859 [Thalassocella blandensis]
MPTKLLIILSTIIFSGCTIKQVVDPVDMSSTAELCIVENSAVKEGFLRELRATLTEKGIKHKIITEFSATDTCEWTATYNARWSWDLTIYLSYAEIKIFRNGELSGQALYDSRSGGANMNKFIDAEPKIRELVNQLINKYSALFNQKRVSKDQYG